MIPLKELEDSKHKPTWFSLRKAKQKAANLGRDIDDFYYSPDDPFEPYRYYKGLVLVRFSPDYVNLTRLINSEEERVNQVFYEQDFFSLFSRLIDKGIALKVYQQLFDMIPYEDRYKTFVEVYSRCERGFSDIPEDFIKRVVEFRKQPLVIPGTDKNGQINIYRGLSLESTPIWRAYSWTLSLRVAVCFAIRFRLDGETGEVYRTKINQRQVAAYITRRKEEEIIVIPSEIQSELQTAEKLTLINWYDIRPKLEDAGIIILYNKYADLLKGEYFLNPGGIHGLGHTKRVLLLNLILAFQLKLEDKDIHILSMAALYHDIGRTNDGVDPRHGLESYRKAEKAGLIRCDTTEDTEVMRFIIENHCLRDDTARRMLGNYNTGNTRDTLKLFNIFKDADGLDRVRLRDLDINQLRTDQAKSLVLVAEQLLGTIKQ